MKRLFSLMLICILLATCIPYTFADETIESTPTIPTTPTTPNDNEIQGPSSSDISWMMAQNIPLDDTTVPLPSISINNEAPSQKIMCSLLPDEATTFLMNQYATDYGEGYLPTHWETYYVLDWRFNEGVWFSEIGALDDALYDIMKHEAYFPNPVQSPVQFCLFDLNNYTPDEYATNALSDIIEFNNGGYYIDFNKHKLEVRLTVSIALADGGIELPTSRIASYYNIPEDVSLPAPTVDHATISLKSNALSFRLAGDSIIKLLQQAEHSFAIYAKYTIDGKEFEQFELQATMDKYYVQNLPDITMTLESLATLSIAYYDKSTKTMSEWTTVDVAIQEEPVVSTIIQPDDYITVETQSVCVICAHCSTPLNMCIYLLIASIVGLGGSAACIIWILTTRTKEKKACPNKNSKTHK